MALIDITDVEVVVKCSRCGDDLSTQETRTRYGNPQIDVAPCETCMEEQHDKGFNEAKEEFDV